MDKKDFLKKSFELIDRWTAGEFVTLRNYEAIPDNTSVENDIDILIPQHCKKYVIENLNKHLDFEITEDTNYKFMYGAEPHIHFINREHDVHLDVVTGLYYRSAMDQNIWVKVNQELTDSVLMNKQKVNKFWKYKPSLEDELVHLCCHCILDKRSVKTEYKNRIEELWEGCDLDRVSYLLKSAFFNTNKDILSCIENRKTDNIVDTYFRATTY